MKEFLRSRSFKIVMACLFLLVGLLLFTASVSDSFASNFFGLFTTPMQQVTTDLSGAADDAMPSGKTVEELEQENAELRKQLEEANARIIDYYKIKQQNQQYQDLYEGFVEITKNNKDVKLVSAAVIGRDPNEMFHGFTVDAGTLSGVEKYDPVIASGGLVGWVSEVGATYCRVTTIFSPDTQVGAIDRVNQDSGVITGSLALTEQGLIKLAYIAEQNTIQAGDIVVTSGLGGVYPRDYPIGSVVEITHEESDATLYATVRPFVDIPNLRDVFIITNFEGQGDVVEFEDGQE